MISTRPGRWPAILFLSALLCMVFAGCGGSSSDDSSSDNPFPLVGTWKLITLESGTESVPCPGSITIDGATTDCDGTERITFKDDGTFTTASTGTEPTSGTWRVSGSPAAYFVAIKTDATSDVPAQEFTLLLRFFSDNRRIRVTLPAEVLGTELTQIYERI